MSELREAIEGPVHELYASLSDPSDADALATVLAAARKYADLKDMVAKGARVVVEASRCEHGYFSGHLVSSKRERCAGGVGWQAMPE